MDARTTTASAVERASGPEGRARRARSRWPSPWRMCRRLLKQGMSPRKLALAMALGFSIGLCPIIGTTTIALTILAVWLRLNLPLIQAANYSMMPFQWLLMIPFAHMGAAMFSGDTAWLAGGDPGALSWVGIIASPREFGFRALCALGAWLLCMPVLIPSLYLVFAALLRKRTYMRGKP